MATVFLCPISAIFQYFNDIGVILAGGKINTYLATTSTPAPTYTDATGTVFNSNPIILASNGRLNNVQIWQPQGIALKIVVTDANNNQIGPIFDQVTGINDSSFLTGIYSSPAPGSGVDLIANAMRSYPTLNDVRAGAVPSFSGNQSLVIRVEGLLAANDGYNGMYYWSPSSSATDDGVTVIKPTAVGVGNGRYLWLRGGAGPIYIAKPNTTARASTTTLSIDPDLVFTGLPNTPSITWEFEGLLLFNGSGGGGGGIAIALGGSGATPTTNSQNLATGSINGSAFAGKSTWSNSGSPAGQITAATITAAASGNDALYISGTISGPTGGNFGINWAQNSSSGNACQMLAGSWIRLSVAK